MPKRNKTALFLVFLIICMAAAFYIGIKKWKEYRQKQKARFTFYQAFGTDIPVGYKIHGIDVSSYQEYIHWASVKQMKIDTIQMNFVFIKATEGLNDADKQFKQNWAEARKDSITRGAYHYFIATKSGKLQAENFIKNVNLQKGDLPPVLDIENLYGVPLDSLRSRIKEWLSIIEMYYKVKPIIYSYVYFYEDYLGADFDEYPLWIAHYDEKEKPRIKRDWVFWQYSEHGHVNGITSPVDFNVFKGDSLSFANLLAH